MSNILVIGDTHIPAVKKGYLDFVLDVYKYFDCTEVVHIGDVVDFHGISYHEHNPDYISISTELSKARKILKKWVAAFPKVYVCCGNHDLLVYRKAKTYGLSKSFFKSFNEILELPDTWQWNKDWYINKIRFTHGKGNNSRFPHATEAIFNRENIAIGHFHSVAGIEYCASKNSLIWGMCVGSGVDDKQCTFDYGENINRKSIISCGVILDGVPDIIPMNL